jgi:phage shock protein PspC (stress-responsive transcriptional regulator)
MAFWLDLMFGNAIGLLSMVVIFCTFGIMCYLMWMFIVKSAPTK